MAPQYCGALGQTANCQSGVFICYSSPRGHALLDSQLYLPKDFDYLAEIACTRKVWLQETGLAETLKTEGCTVEQLLQFKHLLNWQTHKISEGEKGPIVAAFARVRVYLSPERTPESQRWLLLRNDANHKIKYALSNAPETTTMRELVRVSGPRWPIERCFQENKSELGLDHYEHRSWTAWHRHRRLVFLAQLFLIRLQIKLKKNACVDPASSTPAHGVRFSATETPPRLPSDPARLPFAAQRSSLPLSP